MQKLFFFKFIYSLLPDAFILCCFGPKNRISDFEATIWWVFPKKCTRWLKNEQANVCCFFFFFFFVFFTFKSSCPYFSLNLRPIVMSHIHCEMHNKLSKTMGVTIEVYGINNYFTVPTNTYTQKTINIHLYSQHL